MSDIVGIRFKRAGAVYYFDPVGIEVEVGDDVVVETTRGLAVGKVVIAPKQVLVSELTEPLKAVVRKAEPGDLEQMEGLRAKEEEALARCRAMVAQSGLPMKLLAAEYNFDGSHLTLFFSAERRVDFRALVRELTAAFKTRVELHQVGARDEAKLKGGFGRCGRPLCCATYLTTFDSISIKMAKEQDLSLNPAKISGICARLLCCLKYENEQYRLLKAKLPPPGQEVTTPFGEAKVLGGNPLKETVLVQLESEATLELPLAEISAQKKLEGRQAADSRRKYRRTSSGSSENGVTT